MRRSGRVLTVAMVVLLMSGVSGLQAGLVGLLSTPDTSGIISGDDGWSANEGGLRVTWEISQNPDLSWHYRYEFYKADGTPLQKKTSHFIISLSDNIQPGDLYNFGTDITDVSFGTFGVEPGNPGFPAGESIFGVKFNLGNGQAVVEFDSNRQPMWGDFYAKDGKSNGLWNYGYNTDLGTAVANPNDYLGTPVDASGDPLFKILVPDTIPEPATLVILGVGSLLLLRRRV